MYREPSLSRISSRSLSKIKTKIELAFAKPQNNENRSKNGQRSMPVRSRSSKSLAKSKEETAQNHIPFAIAIKSGLMASDRKHSLNETPKKNINSILSEETLIKRKLKTHQKHSNVIVCSNSIKNESIKGYSWYHSGGTELISICKKSQDKFLRYFAMKEKKEGKTIKKVLAALEVEDILYIGSKRFILIESNTKGLINKDEASKVAVQESDFVLVIDESLISFCNINRIVSDIYALVEDGLADLDTIVNIVGRKISESQAKREKEGSLEVFLLIILVQNATVSYSNAEINKKKKQKTRK